MTTTAADLKSIATTTTIMGNGQQRRGMVAYQEVPSVGNNQEFDDDEDDDDDDDDEAMMERGGRTQSSSFRSAVHSLPPPPPLPTTTTTTTHRNKLRRFTTSSAPPASSSSASGKCFSLMVILWLLALTVYIVWWDDRGVPRFHLPIVPTSTTSNNNNNSNNLDKTSEDTDISSNNSSNNDNSNSDTTNEESSDTSTDDDSSSTASVPRSNLHQKFQYDPTAGLNSFNPFATDTMQDSMASWYSTFHAATEESNAVTATTKLGYFRSPHLLNDTLVFISEGDVYQTRLSTLAQLPAARITNTIGNVLTPHVNPAYPHVIAYTATYTGTREVYVVDTNKGTTATRVTFWDTSGGVSRIVGWSSDGQSLVFSAQSNHIGLPDTRLYRLALGTASNAASSSSTEPWKITPIPLSQATEGVFDEASSCWYFVRFSQSSRTMRYVGGTAESIWKYCDANEHDLSTSLAQALFPKYRGTAKSPQLWKTNEDHFLLFLTDAAPPGGMTTKPVSSVLDDTWIPTAMNLWAMDINTKRMIPLTNSICDVDMPVMEYTLDAVTGNVVIRTGADLYLLSAQEIAQKLDQKSNRHRHKRRRQQEQNETKYDNITSNSTNATDAATEAPANPAPFAKVEEKGLHKLPIRILSDFHEQQERIIPVKIPIGLSSLDMFDTVFGTTNTLMVIRGQLWVVPVADKSIVPSPFTGPGMNLPSRRYRVAPGSTMGGSIRILNAIHLPVLPELEKSARRLALVLATDPASPTAEHAFYLLEIQSDMATSFVDRQTLPTPFVGGHGKTGGNGDGSTRNGGLGSVHAESVAISPCGRRFAWTDTDGRICVMTIPLYHHNSSSSSSSNTGGNHFVVLPQQNELGQPMLGLDEVDLSWSPGGRYLAVNHKAQNEFMIISIVDCGKPEGRDGTSIADIQVGRIVQVTPDRFNSMEMYWGKSLMDISIHEEEVQLAKLLGVSSKPQEHATTLYFLSDRDIVTDVPSPWGSRAPSPHFPRTKQLYGLPLTRLDEGGLLVRGRFSGGGAAELYSDEILQLGQVLTTMLETVASAAAVGGHRELSSPSSFIEEQKQQQKKRNPIQAALAAIKRRLKNQGQPAPNKNATKSPNATTNVPASKATEPKNDTTTTPASNKKNTTAARTPTKNTTTSTTTAKSPVSSIFPKDLDIDFGNVDLTFARQAYHVGHIPSATYADLVSQTMDDGSFVMVNRDDEEGLVLVVFAADKFPSDQIKALKITYPGKILAAVGLSSTREHIYLLYLPGGIIKIIPNTAAGLASLMADELLVKSLANTDNMAISVWPALEYQQMYNDAWRLLRDYFYDQDMTGIDWPAVHARYLPLVQRCSKREELDDVLAQMASELSALHVFVYGGDYNEPLNGDTLLENVNQVASLGATLERSAQWNGYLVTSIPQRDPDFNMREKSALYSPLSDEALMTSGQRGLQVGDVIVAVNGESVMRVPDIHMLLRGMAGQSVRLEVLRVASGNNDKNNSSSASNTRHLEETHNQTASTSTAALPKSFDPEPIITVPLTPEQADSLRYDAWEWKTRESAKHMAAVAGFTVGYIHLRSMSGPSDMDVFAKNFFPDFDKQAMIIDVRHNNGGNIDSWLLDILQRKAWSFWQGRVTNITNGGMHWDEHFSFRGHVVVLVNEKTSSDGEGFSRGVSELNLAKLVGTRTWGGGIWLSSDNTLVDGGIATAPEDGEYNDKWGWGMGIEQVGVQPDHQVDNNPRSAFDGVDTQLEAAIELLSQWLKDEPIVLPKAPGKKRDMSAPKTECPAER